MNYPTFLKNIEALTAESDKEKLSAFVLEIARSFPENERVHFLSVLSRYCEAKEELPVEKEGCDNLPEDIDELLEKLDEIEEEERSLHSEYNEDWECWNSEDLDEQYLFSDPEDILDDINRGVSFIHESIDREEYRKGYELALKLSGLTVNVEGDYDEGTMRMYDLLSCNLIDGDFNDIVKECVYLACVGNDDGKRAEAMLTVMKNLGSRSISLEDIIEMSEGRIDLQSFLPSWIETLADTTDWKNEKLLDEAVSMLEDDRLAVEFASRYSKTHPTIYTNILSRGLSVSPLQMMEIGQKAIDEIPGDSSERNDVCLYTAEYAVRSGKQETAESCWLEAFRSVAKVTNYLRLRFMTKDWTRYSDAVKSIIAVKESASKDLSTVRFFDMDFDAVMKNIIGEENSSGRSARYGCVSLFLLLMSNGVKGKGMNAMLEKAVSAASFTTAGYNFGTGIEDKRPDAAVFSECFDRWKQNVNLDEEVCTRWIKNIDIWLQHYVQVAMDNNDRSSYGLYAQYIAALGEVEEARGKTGFKQELMQAYRDMYWRRRSFVDELVKYGYRK